MIGLTLLIGLPIMAFILSKKLKKNPWLWSIGTFIASLFTIIAFAFGGIIIVLILGVMLMAKD